MKIVAAYRKGSKGQADEAFVVDTLDDETAKQVVIAAMDLIRAERHPNLKRASVAETFDFCVSEHRLVQAVSVVLPHDRLSDVCGTP